MSHAAAIPTPETLDLDAGQNMGSASDAGVYVDRLARGHYENFPVLTRLVPGELRDDFAAVYSYCRTCDDLGDETGVGEAARARSLELLGRWRFMFEKCYAFASGDSSNAEVPTHPVFVSLARTIRRHELPPEPFHHLIDAFEQDQRVTRYQTWPQVLDYCTRSADPVGRIILRLAGKRPADPDWTDLVAMSDATCTALQLTNFWQDVRRDLIERDRVYLPEGDTGITADELRAGLDERGMGGDPSFRIRYIHALRELCVRTRAMFDRGRPLPGRLGLPLGRVVWLFGAGGERVLDLVQRGGCTTLWHRPKLSKVSKALLVLRASIGRPWPPESGAPTPILKGGLP